MSSSATSPLQSPTTQNTIQAFSCFVHQKIKEEVSEEDIYTELMEIYPNIEDLAFEETTHVFVQNLDAPSLHIYQYYAAHLLLKKIDLFLQSCDSPQKNFLKNSLSICTKLCLNGFSSRFPRPNNAPQPFWDEIISSIRSLRLEKQWMEMGHTLYKGKPAQLMSGSSSSWKTRVFQYLTLSLESLEKNSANDKEKQDSYLCSFFKQYFFSHLSLWGREPLTSDTILFLLSHISPKESLTFEEVNDLSEAALIKINELMAQLSSLSFKNCKKINFEQIFSRPCFSLQKLALRGVLFKEKSLIHLQLPNLRSLDFTESNISTTQLLSFPRMPHLKELCLDRCYNVNTLFVEMIKSKFPNLEKLTLNRSGSVHNAALSQLPLSLKHLGLSWNKDVNAEGFENLENLPHLRSVHVDHCSGFNEGALEAISNHKNLSSLHINYCQGLSSELIEAYLPNFEKLTDLSLKGLTLYAETWKFIEKLPLKSLSLPYWTNAPYSFVFPKLEHLDLGKVSRLSSENLKTVLSQPSLNGLKSLWLEEPHSLNDDALPALTRLKDLKHLRIWGEMNSIQLFNEQNIPELKKLSKLETLELAYCGVFDLDSLEAFLKSLPQLKQFECGPLYKISPEDIQELRLRLPWIRLTCYQYNGLQDL